MNTSELTDFLPRDVANEKRLGQVADRLPGNKSIEPDAILSGFSRSVIRHAARNGRTVVVAPDQTKISDGFECPAFSCRVDEKKGGMGFDVQKPLLIVLNGRPAPGKIPDCGMRWDLEALFSDSKTRGLPVFMTRLKRIDRITRLLVLIAIALPLCRVH